MTRLDFFTIKSAVTISVILYVVSIIVGFAAKMPEFTLVLAMVLTVFIGGTVFGNQEANHGDVLYATLPVRRQDVVIGRFLYALVLAVAGAIIATVLSLAVSAVIHVQMTAVSFTASLALSFAYYCFAVAVSYPIYFRFGFARAYILTMLPMYIVFLAAVLVTRKLNTSTVIHNAVAWFTDHQGLTWVIGIVGGLVLLIIGAVISTAIYARRDSSTSGGDNNSMLPLSRLGIGR
jgi:ABC-type Fe3+ transport system permease subunit